jgi:hypothetical protein
LWNDTSTTLTVKEFEKHTFTIKRDKTPRGGLLVLSVSKQGRTSPRGETHEAHEQIISK